MQMLRSTVMSLVLTIFVGIGLATSVLAHGMPTGAEQALQALQAAGLPVSAVCGQVPGKTSCPDASCPICPGGAAVAVDAFVPPIPVLVQFEFVQVLPSGTDLPMLRILPGHDAQGPPTRLI